MRQLPLLVVFVLLVLGATWFLMSGDSKVGPVDAIEAEERDTDGSPGPLPSVPSLKGSGQVQPLVPAVLEAPPASASVPESYRRALGGLIGRVIEEDGSPVVDISVAIVGFDYYAVIEPMTLDGLDNPALIDPVLGEVRTDEEGRFRVGELKTRVAGGVIVDPSGPRTVVQILDQTPSTGEVRDIGDIVLPGGVTLRGRVTDERGEPLPNARVRVMPIALPIFPEELVDARVDGGVLLETGEAELGTFVFTAPSGIASLERLLPIPTTHTDAAGEWEMIGLPAGAPKLLYDKLHHVGRSQQLGPTGPPGSVVEVGDVPLVDGVTLTGRVLDERGDPVADAEVMAGNAVMLAPMSILQAPVRSDAEGYFSFDGLRPGQAQAAARRNAEEQYVASKRVLAGQVEAEIRLPSGSRLTIDLRDEAGEPITDVVARGRILPMVGTAEVPDFLIPPKSLDGRHRLDEEDRVVFDELQSGYWDISFRAEGYALHRELFDLGSGDVLTSLALTPELGLEVLVLGAVDGEPIEHALVVARQAKEESTFGGRAVSSTRTDEEGVAWLGHLMEGEVSLEVSHPALAVVEQSVEVPADAVVIVELPEGGSISGQIFGAGDELQEPVMIVLMQHSGSEANGLPRMTVSDLEGKFSFTNAQPGDSTIQARERVGKISSSAPLEAFINSPLAKAEIEVQAGVETEVVLVLGTGAEGLETGSVSGRLLVNGMAEAGWTVRTWGELRRSTTTEPDGSFDLGLVVAGEVQLIVSPPGQSLITGAGATHIETLELAINDAAWVEIAFDTTAVHGVVRDARTGLPLHGVNIRGRSLGENTAGWWGESQGAGLTDADGAYELRDIRTGEYQIEAKVHGYARAMSEPILLRVGERPRVDLKLTSGIEVEGTLVIQGVEGEEPARWILLTASTADGRESATRPGKEGRFHFDDMSEGDWTFRLLSSYDVEFEQATASVGPGVNEITLVFAPLVEVTPISALQEQGEFGDG